MVQKLTLGSIPVVVCDEMKMKQVTCARLIPNYMGEQDECPNA